MKAGNADGVQKNYDIASLALRISSGLFHPGGGLINFVVLHR